MKAKRMLTSFAVFFLSSFIIVYIIVQLVSTLTTDVAYEYASLTKVESALEKNAYLVRNETVLYSDSEGILTYSVSESEKLGKGQLVATAFADTKGVDIQNQIQQIDAKISVLQRSRVDASYLTSDVSKIDNSIYSSLCGLRSAVLNDDIYLTTKEKEKLLISLNKRHLIISSEANYDEKLNELQKQKNDLMASLQNPLCSVYSSASGYFSTLLDGYETVFTPECLDNMNLDSFHQLIQKPKVEYSPMAVGKIVTDFSWHALCEVTSREAEDFVVGKTYPLTFLYSSGSQLNAVLQRKITQTDSDSVVFVFLINEVPGDFDYTRQQSVKIVKETHEGIEFSQSALRLVNGEQGVYVIAGNSVEFRKVDILYAGDSKYYSREFKTTDEEYRMYLNRFDRVITEGKDLYVGKILD